MKFYVTERLSGKQSLTKEGFLLCEGVPIARTGEMLYGPGEVPVPAGPDGLIRVARLPEEVFKPEHILSYNGKPVVDNHPQDGEVTPSNWRQLAVGVVQNARRGPGILDDFILADLLITDANAILAVQEGKRQVSCGYDADYETVEPGRGIQHNLIGNHVALVDQARCGPRCSIGDHDHMPKTLKARILAWASGTRDAKALDEMLEGQEMDGEGAETAQGSATHLHVHMGANESGAPSGENKDGEPNGEKDPLKEVKDALGALNKRLDGYDAKFEAFGKKDKGEGEEGEGEEGAVEEQDPEAKATGNIVGDGNGGKRVIVKDSAALSATFQDTLSRAEILVPGIKAPTFDAKLDAKKTVDTMCAFRRRALMVAAASGPFKESVSAIVGDRDLTSAKLTCDQVKTLFISASEVAKTRNNDGTQRQRAKDNGSNVERPGAIKSIADLNARNRKDHGQPAR